MNNKIASLKEPMNFNRSDGDFTPLETSILKALGTTSLEYKITGQRLRSHDFSRLEIDV